MQTKIRHFYAGGNTAKGFVHFYDSLLQGLDRVFILKGGPGTGKSTLIRNLVNKINGGVNQIWVLHCASDNDSLDGVIIPDWKAAIVDGTAPHIIEPKYPGAVEEYVNLGDAWNSKVLALQKERIITIQTKINRAYDQAYQKLRQALQVHDDWEAVYMNHMNYEEADRLAHELIQQFFTGKTKNKKADVSHRFLGAATPQGAVDFIPNLTEDVSRRFFIKGRPGSGKSTMLKKIAAAAQENGLDTEIYHCGFDPDSLDMLIFREIGIAIFDSTAPHEYFPEREGDEIIDMYTRCITTGTDEANAKTLAVFQASYAEKMKQATHHLAEAKQFHDQLEDIYVAAMDFSVINQKRDWIEEQLDMIAENAML